MIIGHLSDTHLGACIGSEPEREGDYYNAFMEAIEIFIKEHVDFVIHSGDILDEPRPYGTAMKILLQGVMELRKHDIPFLFTLGEHDISNVPSTPHPILLQLQGIGRYIGDGEPYEVGGATVIGLHKHRRVERGKLLRKLGDISRQLPNLSGKKILVLHQGVRECGGPGSELSIHEMPTGLNYYAMGHLHKPCRKDWGTGLLSYPGATHWVDLGDPMECGICLVDLSGDQASVERILLKNVRPKIMLEVSARELEAKLAELEGAEYPKKPCLWLSISTDRELDMQALEKRLSQRFIVKKIKQEPVQREGVIYPGAPEINLDEELKRLAIKALSNESAVNFALHELLPRLASGELAEAKEAVWRFFKGGGWRDNED
ncbi:MAG: DNA repair exonuclease [Aigarchaeota archaeon]|nr:DNA repair exonuclease [Aigarchaeota archaeon]MDW8021257.1 DNA repair exonuclease [Nitrososphaerota archaeon]